MNDGFVAPNNFEEATALWNSLGRKLTGAHVQRAYLAFAILTEHNPAKYGQDWTAETLGEAWGVTGERIRRYARTVKVFGADLQNLTELPKVSWTHLEEVARVADADVRAKLLESIQSDGLSSNEVRARVSSMLAGEDGAAGAAALPELPGYPGKKAIKAPEQGAFNITMEQLAAWAEIAAKAMKCITARFSSGDLLAVGGVEQGGASDARNMLDELRDAIQELRPFLCGNTPPPPAPESADSTAVPSEEKVPDLSVGRTVEV